MIRLFGTASVVLFCMALRCSPNLSRSARFVCPMYSAGAIGVFLHFRHWIMQMRFLDAVPQHFNQKGHKLTDIELILLQLINSKENPYVELANHFI